MAESTKKSTKVLNSEKTPPDGNAKPEHFFNDEFGQMLVDNLNRNVLLEEAERRPLTEEEQKALGELNEKRKKLEADSQG